jgi:hypothetical protein
MTIENCFVGLKSVCKEMRLSCHIAYTRTICASAKIVKCIEFLDEATKDGK